MSDDNNKVSDKRDPAYLRYISSKVSDDLYEKIIRILHVEKNIEIRITQQKTCRGVGHKYKICIVGVECQIPYELHVIDK